jgi:hypothetical protein
MQEYEYSREGWYYNVHHHQCLKISIKDGYYPTDNFYKTESDCDTACHESHTMSSDNNLDPTYECKSRPVFYSKGSHDSQYSGVVWTYLSKYQKCVSFEYPVSDYQHSYNVFYSRQECEDFCINYLYDNMMKEDSTYGDDDAYSYDTLYNNYYSNNQDQDEHKDNDNDYKNNQNSDYSANINNYDSGY